MSMQVMTLVAFLTLQSTSPLTELLNLSPEKSAISQIQEHAKLLPADFALQDGDELSNYLLLPIKNGFIVKAQRLHQGIVVRNEMISMRFDAKGKLLYSHNNFTTLQI